MGRYELEEAKLEITRSELGLLIDVLNDKIVDWKMNIKKWRKEAEKTGEKQYEMWVKFAEYRIKKITSFLDKLHKLEHQFGHHLEHLT